MEKTVEKEIILNNTCCPNCSSDEGSQCESNGGKKTKNINFIIGSLFFLTGLLLKMTFWMEFGIFFISYILIGGKVLFKASKNLIRGKVFDENFLMSIATIGAFAIGEFSEGVAVMLFYQIGEYFQDSAVNRSKKSITELMDIRPDYANLKVDEDVSRVSPSRVKTGDTIVIKPGEKIPLDGIVTGGNGMIDISALTGESMPREVEVGSEVLSGSININGFLVVNVTKEFGESTVSKILDLVQNASNKKAMTENFITKFARFYTPVVVFVAIALAILPPLVITGASFSDWIYRALVFLVISCPCALVISIPLSYFGGIGGASRNGILIKGGNYLEALNNVDTVVFDKTGTLTKGVFSVGKINNYSDESNEKLLEYAAFAETYSNHPIAISILNAYGKEINKNEIEKYSEITGYGTEVKVGDKKILVGNAKLMKKNNILFKEPENRIALVHIAVNGEYIGNIEISDELKHDSKKTMQELKRMGISKLIMLTGDNKVVGKKIGDILEIDEVYSELLPDGKVEKLEELDRQKRTNGRILFVGDGINDAPVLARADIGVAMGGLGSDAAIEAADIVIMNDEPSKLISAIKIANRTRNIVWQNIIFALGVKVIVLILGAIGITSMWEAVFADVGVALIAVLNAMRVMKVNRF